MRTAMASASALEVTDQYRARIEVHLVRLAEGHDPAGHLLGIERLARAARAEWWAARHEAIDRRGRP
jgi:hypothetical protein